MTKATFLKTKTKNLPFHVFDIIFIAMNEVFLYEKKVNKDADYNLWMMFPNVTSFAMSSLGYLWLYKLIDEAENINTERICTDTKEIKIPPAKVDAIGISFSFDFDFLGMLEILDKYKIPFKSKDRKNSPFKNILIFGGGPVLTANPEPYEAFFDFILMGDGDELNKTVIDICKKAKADGITKEETLKKLSETEGIYVPSLKNKVKKICCNIKETVHTPILSENSFFPNTFIVEVSRGCSNRCGFCIASYLNMPVRFADYDDIIDKINLGLKHTDKIALLGALVSSHPKFYDIIRYIDNLIENGRKIELGISSIRADALTPEVIKTLVKAGQKHITIAIEAASEHLRKVINKNLTEEQIKNAVKMARENGLKGIKIYAIIGLPTETDEDIKEFIRLAKDLKNENKGFGITFSFSTFVPKPHTPFQYCKREDTESIKKKEDYLKKEFHKLGVGAKFSSAKWDYYQTVLSNGDASLTDFLIEAYKLGGKLGAFKTAAKNLNIDTDKFMNGKTSLEFTDTIPDNNYLRKEYERLINPCIDNS